jgi:hypothetical protein
MNKKNKLTKILATLTTSLLILIVSSSGATAVGITPQIAILCDPYTDSYYLWSNVQRGWQVTHVDEIEHFTTGTRTVSTTATKVNSYTASKTLFTGATVGATTPIGSLGLEVNLTLRTAGSSTTSTSVTITDTVHEAGTYIFYRGNRTAKGDFTQYQCNSNGTAFNVVATGKAFSFQIAVDGALQCSLTPNAGSLAAFIKPRYCL